MLQGPRVGVLAGLHKIVELEEARAFNNWLGQKGSGVSRLTEAVHRQVPQLRYARAERRGVERARRSCATVNEDTPGARLQPARFEQVVGYLERNSRTAKATSFVTSHFYLAVAAAAASYSWGTSCGTTGASAAVARLD